MSQRKPIAPLILALLSLLAFVPIAVGIATHAHWPTVVDQSVIAVVTAFRPRWLTAIMLVITNLGNPLSVVLLGALLAAVLAYFRRRRYAVFAAVSVVLMSGVNHLIKSWFARPRPFVADPTIHPLAQAGGYSFPSGHSAGAMLLYGTCILIVMSLVTAPRWRNGLIAVSAAMIVLTGVSRIYVQVHYPTDVLAGWSLGAAGLLFLWWLMVPWLTAVTPTGWHTRPK